MVQEMRYSGFDFDGIEAIWDEYRELTIGRSCDQFETTNERLATETLQWPYPTENHPGTARRYTNHQFATPDRHARFIACEHQRPKELSSSDYPLEKLPLLPSYVCSKPPKTENIKLFRRSALVAHGRK
jgi:hypothetical protein